MVAGLIILLVIIVLCLTVVACEYIYLCSENEVGVFETFSEKERVKQIVLEVLNEKEN